MLARLLAWLRGSGDAGREDPRTHEEEVPMRDIPRLVASLAEPAIHVVKSEAPSLSHFGGDPGLPPGIPWPERDRRRLDFLARLSLSEIQRAGAVEWLPASGALLFFYDLEQQPWGFDPKDRGGSRVLLVPDLPRPIDQPPGAGGAKTPPLPHRNLSFRRIGVFPSWERECVAALALSDQESDAYSEHSGAVFGDEEKHQVSGFPAPVQGDDMALQCQLVTNGLYCGTAAGYKDPRAKELEPGAKQWRLLFQMDSDDELGVMWGDSGTLYCWVEEGRARAGDFANAWVVLQCY